MSCLSREKLGASALVFSSPRMSERARYDGETGPIVDLARPLAVEPGWFKYAEKDQAGALKPKALKPLESLWRGLRDLQQNMAFTQELMKKAMVELAAEKPEWNLSEAEKRQQTEVMARRLRLACRHISQGLAKKNPPKWVQELMDCEAGDDEQPEEEEDEKEQPADSEWPFWGWEPEAEVAWRAKALHGQGRQAQKQTTKVIEKPPNPKPHMSMLGVFSDGKKYELSDLTVEKWDMEKQAETQEAAAAAASRKEREPFWSALHKSSGLEVCIKARADRQPLMSLYHGTSQVCQVPISAFGSEEASVVFLKVA